MSVCKLRVAGPPACLPGCRSESALLPTLEVEKLDLRVVPAFSFSFFFFFFFLAHTALCTPDRVEAYLKPAGVARRAGKPRMSEGGREGGRREGPVLFHSHLHSGFSCLFQPPPAETFQLPEIRVTKLFPEVSLQRLGACFLHVRVCAAYVHPESRTQTPRHGARCEGEGKNLDWLPRNLDFSSQLCLEHPRGH